MPKLKLIVIALLFATILPVSAQEFADVPALHTFAVGYAGTESKVYKSFRAVLDKGEEAKPIFRQCLKTGSPAAKLYSAIGLYKLDPQEGTTALKSLASSDEKVPVMQGCIVSTYTVGEVASDLLSPNPQLLSFRAF